jgi:PAS domain S-box-containing protein
MVESVVQSHAEIVVDSTEKSKIRVLLVDDELGLLKVAKQCLELQGPFHVDTANSVEEALNKLKEKEYDAVISDYQMPGKDGLEFLEMLRKNGNTIPFIMFTGKGREEVAVKAWSLGADHYVNKTGNPETVYCELAHCLRSTVEKHFAEAQMKETVQKLQTIYQNAVEGITYVDPEENIVYANKAFADIIGYEQEQLAGMNLRRFVDEESWAKIRTETEKHLKGKANRYELIFRRTDGTTRNVQISGSPLFDSDGGFAGTVGIVLDVTASKNAEETAKESEEKWHSLFEMAPDGMATTDMKGVITSVNSAFLRLTGYKREDIVGKRFTKLQTIKPKDIPKYLKLMISALRGRLPEPFEYSYVRKDGTIGWGEAHVGSLKKNSKTIGYQMIFREITERKNAEESLRTCAQRYEKLFESSRMGVVISGPDGKVSSANPAAARMLGYSGPKELVGLAFLESCVDQNQRKMLLKQLMGKGYVQGFKAFLKRKDDSQVRIEANITLYKDTKRNVLRTENVFTEISEREKAEEELRESEERFRSLFESIRDPVGIFVGREGRLIDYNTAFKKSSGYTDEELKGKKFLDFVHPDDRALVLEKYQTEYSEEELPLVYEIRGMNKKGESLPLEISVSPYKKKGRAIGIEVIHRDITERKRYERSLSTLNIHSLKLNTAKSMEEIYELTLDAAEKTLGFEFADVFMVKGKMLQLVTHRGKTEISSLSLPMEGDRGISVRAARTGKLVLIPDTSKDHAYVDVGLQTRSELVVPIKIGPRVLGVLNVESKKLNAFNEKDQELLEILASHAATAISNLDRAKELEAYALEIRESQQMFERLFIDGPEAAVHLDSSFHILNVNPRFSRLFDYSLDEVKGRHINDIIVPKDKIEEAIVFDEKASKGEIYHEDTVRKRKDGSSVSVALSAAPIIIENQVIGHIAVYKDISQLKKAEDELRKMLQKLDKMNEKLRVVGGLTRHDVRNKLSTITGNAYLLKKQLAGNSEVLDKLGDMEKAVQQTVKIFDFAKAYEMLETEELVYNDVEKTVNEAISLFANRNNIKVINDCHGLTILADSLLRQLFYNLIDNSLKYGQKTARIRVYYEKTGQDSLKLVYEDDGIGIPVAEKPKLFKEGYSTGGSTGYGLYLIKKIVEVYGWTIQETGTPGKGARFTMVIPEKNQNGKENYQLH